jgi:hypothetical protein
LEPIVVGIVHPDERLRRLLGERLEGEQGLLLAGVSSRARDLRLPEAGARVVVVGGPSLDDPDLTALGIPTVVVSSGTLSEARAALTLDAAGLVGWPKEAGDLANTVRQAAALNGTANGTTRGKVLAVIGARGGLGTSTLAAWLAAALDAQALIELDASGSLSSYRPDTEPLLGQMLAASGSEHCRKLLRDVGIGVPVCFGEPGRREPESVACRALLTSLRGLGGWSVIDLGRADGGRGLVAREADARILLACDEVAAVRSVVARGFAGAPWVRRQTARRSGIAANDLREALGGSELGVIEHDPAVARAADAGKLAPIPQSIKAVAAHFEPSLPAIDAAPVIKRPLMLGKLRATFGAFR